MDASASGHSPVPVDRLQRWQSIILILNDPLHSLMPATVNCFLITLFVAHSPLALTSAHRCVSKGFLSILRRTLVIQSCLETQQL